MMIQVVFAVSLVPMDLVAIVDLFAYFVKRDQLLSKWLLLVEHLAKWIQVVQFAATFVLLRMELYEVNRMLALRVEFLDIQLAVVH